MVQSLGQQPDTWFELKESITGDYATRTMPGQGGYPRTFPRTISRVPYDDTSLVDDLPPFLLIYDGDGSRLTSQASAVPQIAVLLVGSTRDPSIFRVTLAFPRRPVH